VHPIQWQPASLAVPRSAYPFSAYPFSGVPTSSAVAVQPLNKGQLLEIRKKFAGL
jgi:hypothetical protein